MSAPSSSTHTLSSLFLKTNCLHNSSISIISNAYWINLKTIDTRLSSLQGSLTKALVTFLPPQERATTTHTFIFKPWTISDCQPKFFIILVSHRNLKNQGGTRFGNRKEQICSRKLMYLQEGKCLFNDFFFFLVSPQQESMTTVKVWENVIIQWITLLVIKNSNSKLTKLQASWKLEDNHIHINQPNHAYPLFQQCHSH